MLLDDEVLAVILAVVVIASILGVALTLRDYYSVEPFTALGLLDSSCKIGDYPKRVIPGDNVTLCIYVYNHEGKPIYWSVVYKIGSNETLPTQEKPSSQPPIAEWRGVLSHGANETRIIVITIPKELKIGEKVALIFELWLYDAGRMEWVYSGRWNHLYVSVVG
ncbi:MAG: DUF1616 domain-containing protein [Sulfolobales archaeon]